MGISTLAGLLVFLTFSICIDHSIIFGIDQKYDKRPSLKEESIVIKNVLFVCYLFFIPYLFLKITCNTYK